MSSKKIPRKEADKFCNALRSEKKEEVYYDSEVKGLRLKVRKSGGKYWSLAYKYKKADGTYQSRTIGIGAFAAKASTASEALSVYQARKIATQIRSQTSQGVDPVMEKRRQKYQAQLEYSMSKCVKEICEAWLAEVGIDRADQGKEARRMLGKDVYPAIGEVLLRDVTRLHIGEINTSVRKRGKRIASVVFSLIRQIFSWAQGKGFTDKNPTDGIKKSDVGSSGNERDRVLSEQEIIELFSKLPISGLPRPSQLALIVQLATSCRIGELLQARWSDINIEQSTWFIPASNTKTSVALTVYLSNFCRPFLTELKTLTGHSEWCFPARSGLKHIDLKNVTKLVSDRQRQGAPLNGRTAHHTSSLVLSSNQNERWTPHDLRRTSGTLMVKLGVAPHIVDKCQNHVEQNRIRRTYQRYQFEDECREAWSKLGELLESLYPVWEKSG